MIDSDKDMVPDCVDRCPGLNDHGVMEHEHSDSFETITCMETIPAVGTWGLVALSLLLVIAGAVRLRFPATGQP